MQPKSRETRAWIKKEFPFDFSKQIGKRSKPTCVKIEQSMFLQPVSLNKREAKQLRKLTKQQRMRDMDSESSELAIHSESLNQEMSA